MAEKHPYSPGGGGSIVKTITQLRKAFPSTVSSETLTKLGLAPNNESYLINLLRFVGVIDEKGAKTSKAATIFSKHNDSDFQKGFSEIVQAAYKDLFDLHGGDAWKLGTDQLISFFRGADQTSDIVGKRQAQAFQALASLCGHGEPTKAASSNAGTKKVDKKSAKTAKTAAKGPTKPPAVKNGDLGGVGDVGLTVRIEINLPASGDQETYDRIFKSIRQNLLRG
jgi:hypothetical protein